MLWNLYKMLKKMCTKGVFNLTKFVSDSRRVIMSVSPENRAKEIKGLDLGQDRIPIERALGVQWCIESDTFKFRIELKDRPCTRGRIPSTINSVYDPLGFIAPVILGSVNNVSRGFHVYVANRLQLIRDHTSPAQWRYVESASNPADECSRGRKGFSAEIKMGQRPRFLVAK